METLFDKVMQGKIQPADAVDIALSLSYRIADHLISGIGDLAHLDPAGILLDEDNHVSLATQERPVDCFYAAPDVVLEDAAPSADGMLFSLGCVLFFMLNRQSYHEAYDLDPFELAETKPGDGLVDSRYQGLANDTISALTAWDPAARSAGVTLLVQIAETIPARAVVRYTNDNRVIKEEEVELTEDLEDFARGNRIMGDDGVAYMVLPGAKIPFRPGTHTVEVPVVSELGTGAGVVQIDPRHVNPPAPAADGEPWLVVSFPNPQDETRTMAVRLLPINGQSQVKQMQISLMQATKYQFYRVFLNPQTGRPGKTEKLFYVNVPADSVRKRAVMRIRYHAQHSGFSVDLWDSQNRPLCDARHFQFRGR